LTSVGRHTFVFLPFNLGLQNSPSSDSYPGFDCPDLYGPWSFNGMVLREKNVSWQTGQFPYTPSTKTLVTGGVYDGGRQVNNRALTDVGRVLFESTLVF